MTTETDGEIGSDAAGGDEIDTDGTGERDTEADRGHRCRTD
jgi:hypothetical protein